jgi:hypothetical protein
MAAAQTMKTSVSLATRSRIILFMFLAPWTFDYRAEVGDSIAIFIQVFALGASLIGFVTSLVFLPATFLTKEMRFVSLALMTYITGAVVVGLFEGQDFRGVITLALPTLLLLMGVKAIPAILKSTTDLRQFIRDLSAIALFGELFKLIWYFGIYDASILEVRYQILGSGVIFLSAYMLGRFLTRLSFRDVCIALIHFGSIILSVTRSQLLVLGAMFAANLLMRPQLILSKAVLSRIVAAIFTAIVLVSASVVSGNVFAERWVERLITAPNEIGLDVTAATRLAEVEFQLSALMESPKAFLVGHGLAAKNQLVGFYYELVREAIGPYELEDIGFGHTLYTSILFQSGILFGSLALIALVYLFAKAIVSLKVFAPRASRSDVAFIGLWGASCVIGTSIFGFVGSSLGDRGISLYFGTATAMMIWAFESSNTENVRQHGSGAARRARHATRSARIEVAHNGRRSPFR